MNDWKRRSNSLTNALGLLVAASTTAAIVLTSAGEYERPTRALATDANEQRGGAAPTVGAATVVPSNAPYDDPELMRLDHANDHHG
jgi:hypothetical protein